MKLLLERSACYSDTWSGTSAQSVTVRQHGDFEAKVGLDRGGTDLVVAVLDEAELRALAEACVVEAERIRLAKQ